ncbi:MAG TPA: zinc ABC transporter substrate-binding protein [Planctomycetes bacterium]|nr:zinc ABC transporter substrate-binding protein [Planctomycetota bacterium]
MNTKTTLRTLALSSLFLAPVPALARSVDGEFAPGTEGIESLEVVTTLPVLADIAKDVGGEFIHVAALSTPNQDPHYVQPTPVLMQKARGADVFIECGLQLELWGEKVAAGSGNPKIQVGQPGRVIASTGVETLELPTILIREWGDVHPYGNPHVWLDPLNAKILAKNIAEAFSKLDAPHADAYRANLAEFEHRIDVALFGADLVDEIGGRKLARLSKGGRLEEYLEHRGLSEMLGGWLAKAAPLRGRPIVTYHKTFIYLATRFGFEIPIEIEEKPGIPPSAKQRDRVLKLIRDQGVHTILQAVYHDRTAGTYLAKETGAHLLSEPIDVGEDVGIPDYFALMDNLVSKLVESESTHN